MSAEFIKLISDLYSERFNAHLIQLATTKTPVGIFYGFELVPNKAVKNVQSFGNAGLNVTCVIVLADRQADVLRNFVDVPVVTLEDFVRFGEKNFPVKPQEVFVPNVLNDVVFEPYFSRHGIDKFGYLNSRADEYFCEIMRHMPDLYAVHESFIDDESKKVFRATIKGWNTCMVGDYRYAPEPQYFLDGFTPTAGDIAIDGGTYDGATAESFAKCGAQVFAFEMDERNYQIALALVGENPNITLENLGLSDKECEENYWSGYLASAKTQDGNARGKFIDLDTYVERKNLPRVDYIKLDIEGAELEMLHGAAKIISRCKPKMAISAYHRYDDLWTLATYIKSLRPDYEFAFRHYKIDCTNYLLDDEQRAILKYFGLEPFIQSSCEMVLYCR